MLEPGEQALFQRLGVFVGGFSLHSAEMVCRPGEGNPLDIVAGVESLVEKSVLKRVPGPSNDDRFTMLETIREYSIEQLEASTEAGTLRRRHADHYLGVAEEADRNLYGRAQATYLAQLDREHDNIRDALDFSRTVADGGSLSLRLASAVWRFWLIRGYLGEAHQRLFTVLAQASPSADGGSRAKVVTAAGFVAFFAGDLARAVALSEEGVALCREAGERWHAALSLNMLGTVARSHARYSEATRFYEEALGIARDLGDTWLLAMCLSNLGNIAFVQGKDEGTERMEQGLALFTEAGDPWYVAMMLNFLGRVERRRGHHHRTRILLEESVTVYRRLGNTWGLALCLDAFACLAEAQAQPERAARLLGAEAAMREAVGVPIYPTIKPEHERCVDAARKTLGEDRFSAAWSAGRSMSLDESIAYALEPEQ